MDLCIVSRRSQQHKYLRIVCLSFVFCLFVCFLHFCVFTPLFKHLKMFNRDYGLLFGCSSRSSGGDCMNFQATSHYRDFILDNIANI